MSGVKKRVVGATFNSGSGRSITVTKSSAKQQIKKKKMGNPVSYSSFRPLTLPESKYEGVSVNKSTRIANRMNRKMGK